MRGSRRIAGALVCALGAVSGCGRIGFHPLDAGAPVDATPIDAPGADGGGCPRAGDPCDAIPALPSAPVLDGVREPCAATVEVLPVGWTDPTPMPAVSARAAIAWRPDGLYVYVEVDDPDLHPASASLEAYCGDGIELYVDDDGTYAVASEYDVPGTVQLIVAAPDTPTGSSTHAGRWVFGHGSSVWPSTRFVMIGRPGGYALETLIQAEDLGLVSWSPSGRVGLGLSIDVSTSDGRSTPDPADCGARLGQFFLRVVPADAEGCGQPYCDTRAFCAPALL